MTIHFSSVPATFRHCPRTASTSFKFWVLEHIKDADVVIDADNKHGGLQHLTLDKIKERWPNYGITFGFVRNPYARLVSVFHFQGQRALDRIEKRKYDSDQPFSLDVDLKLIFNYKKGFTHWIKNTPFVAKTSKHFTNMSLYHHPNETQFDCFSGVVPDIVIKLENIETEFNKIQELVNCYVPFLHINGTEHTNYKDYYTTETEQIARKWLEKDLDTFEYIF